MRILTLLLLLLTAVFSGCEGTPTQERKDQSTVQMQQAQYAARQAVPVFDFSYERNIVIQLYQIRNKKVATYAVWRSDTGIIEGDCPCLGYPIPYTTSLTNGLQVANHQYERGITTIGQAEPNGLFPSKNTSATWVPCADGAGGIDPIYVEGKVTMYPFPVTVDYDKNRVRKAGESQVKITSDTK